MKVLLIEDNAAVVMALRRALRTLYLVDAAGTGTDGIHAAVGGDYDTIVLDLLLPDMEGLEVCRRLRQRGVGAPIMILTGQDGVEQKVRLLDAGANDYMTKPFSLEEFKARLRVLVRRELASNSGSVLRTGDLVINLTTRQVERAEQPITLRRKEYALLEYMMHNAGKVLTRSMIIDHVWEAHDNLWTNSVDVHIMHLRDKIDRPFDGKPLISTIHGLGYKLEVPEGLEAAGVGA